MKRKRRKRMIKSILPIAVLLLLSAALVVGIILLTSGDKTGGDEGALNIGASASPEAAGTEPAQSMGPDTSPDPGAAVDPSIEPTGSYNAEFPYDVGDGVVITGINRYAGMFVEDGSDEIVSGVLMLTVENNSQKNVQLMNITMTDADGKEYKFELTTLPAGAKLTALEKNRAQYAEGMDIVTVALDELALFESELSLYEDILKITCQDRVITVENISQADFAGGRVFYKNASGDTLIGGITYMVNIPALAPGEESALTAAHYLENASKLMFVTYAG